MPSQLLALALSRYGTPSRLLSRPWLQSGASLVTVVVQDINELNPDNTFTSDALKKMAHLRDLVDKNKADKN
jgi:hypothetical protein